MAAKPATVRFFAQVVPEDLGKVVMRVEDKEEDPFDLPMNNLTPELKAPARLFVPALSGRETPIARVSLPDQGSSFIVLLLVTKKGGYEPVILSPDRVLSANALRMSMTGVALLLVRGSG